MSLGDVKNCKAFFASANYPYSEDFNLADHNDCPDHRRGEDEYCQGTSTLCANFKESEYQGRDEEHRQPDGDGREC